MKDHAYRLARRSAMNVGLMARRSRRCVGSYENQGEFMLVDPSTRFPVAGFHYDMEPQDVIEWLWVKDVVNLSWEILRFRRLKIDLVEIDREDKNATIEWEREHFDEPYIDVFSGKLTPRDTADIEARKNKPLLDTETDSVKLLFKHIEEYEHIERLLTSAELRRDRILREIELRRDHMGRRLRAASDEILDARVQAPRIAAE